MLSAKYFTNLRMFNAKTFSLYYYNNFTYKSQFYIANKIQTQALLTTQQQKQHFSKHESDNNIKTAILQNCCLFLQEAFSSYITRTMTV